MRLIITAPRGKMGKVITAAAFADKRFSIVAGIGPAGRAYIGEDIGLVSGLGQPAGAPVTDDLEAVIDGCDVIIDFSTKALSLAVLDLAARHKKALVCGTTGFSSAEAAEFKKASAQIPVILAANTSRVVNCMNRLLELCAATFGEEADIEIIEMHDRNKIDAPSGTSGEMGEIIARARGGSLHELAVYGRHGAQPRVKGSIGYHSVRAGSTPSSHIVIFGFMGERLEIAHHSYNWECFALGACAAAYFLKDKQPGLYSIQDTL
jgi:4-hydroxy-tetrahydrodipicolinate reductase